MREIKFRAWDKIRKQLEPQFDKHIVAEYGTEYVTTAFRFIGNDDWSNPIVTFATVLACPNRYTLMQFTGLLDKNKKEICEGDIVRIVSTEEYYHDEDGTECDEYCKPKCEFQPHGEKTVVEWKSDWGGFMWSESDLFDGEYTMPFSDLADNYTFEVIGNIYENPELVAPPAS